MRKQSTLAGFAAIGLIAALHIPALPGTTDATWTAQQQATSTVQAATVLPPTAIACRKISLLGLLSTAELTWNNVALPTKYRVTVDTGTAIRSTDVAEGTGSSTSVRTSSGIIGDLLGSLGTLLGNGQTLTVSIQSIYEPVPESLWVSPSSTTTNVKYISLLAGTDCA